MTRKEITFSRERVAHMMQYSKELAAQSKLTFDVEEYLADTLIAELDMFLYTQTQEERTLTYYCGRPKFLDWLLRRRIKAEWTLNVRDVLLDPPPEDPPTIRLYEINPKL